MKANKIIIGALLLLIVFVLSLPAIVPIYSKQVTGCAAKAATMRKSLLFGDTKKDIDKEAQKFLDWSEQFDCPVNTVTYKLFII